MWFKQQKYKKAIQEVMRCKRKVPSSRFAGPDRKKRPPIRETNKRVLMSFSASTKQVKKRVKKTKENFAQVPAEDLKPGPEEGSLQSSRIQQGRSSPYNFRRRRDVTREAGSRPSRRAVQAQGGPVRSRRESFCRPPISIDSPDNKVSNSRSRV
ncbi:uncharacterized protein TNCV_2076211 [Trichonephila clavipes]|nr:uncharacterized protein TNCV_2076211 [Trichonephila clavipes]